MCIDCILDLCLGNISKIVCKEYIWCGFARPAVTRLSYSSSLHSHSFFCSCSRTLGSRAINTALSEGITFFVAENLRYFFTNFLQTRLLMLAPARRWRWWRSSTEFLRERSGRRPNELPELRRCKSLCNKWLCRPLIKDDAKSSVQLGYVGYLHC